MKIPDLDAAFLSPGCKYIDFCCKVEHFMAIDSPLEPQVAIRGTAVLSAFLLSLHFFVVFLI